MNDNTENIVKLCIKAIEELNKKKNNTPLPAYEYIYAIVSKFYGKI
jgi:hypothetical protein